MMVRVILAFLRVSSRKAITPLLTAQRRSGRAARREDLSSSHRLTMAVAEGTRAALLPVRMTARGNHLPDAGHNNNQQRAVNR